MMRSNRVLCFPKISLVLCIITEKGSGLINSSKIIQARVSLPGPLGLDLRKPLMAQAIDSGAVYACSSLLCCPKGLCRDWVGLGLTSQCQEGTHFLLILEIHFVLIYYFLRQEHIAQASLNLAT